MTALVCANEARHFRITHPFHPYRGREFELTDPQEAWVEGSLRFRDESDFPQRIPAVWTDLAVADAFTEVAAGRSVIHGDCLWPLTELIHQLSQEGPHDA